MNPNTLITLTITVFVFFFTFYFFGEAFFSHLEIKTDMWTAGPNKSWMCSGAGGGLAAITGHDMRHSIPKAALRGLEAS